MTGGVVAVSTALLAGCSGTTDDVLSDGQPTYKSSTSAPPLEVPPDLTNSTIRDTLRLPDVDATYSQYASDEESAGTQVAGILPEVVNARIERSGAERWLVVAMQPDEAWSKALDFWSAQGFLIESEDPAVGIMETNWAAKVVQLPAGFFKRLVNELNDAVYGVEFRDQFRTRIERGTETGTAEIYISHRGAEQMVVGGETPYAKREGLGERVWQPRPNDPELEAEMLSRLMLFLGGNEDGASTVAAAPAPEPRARLVEQGDIAVALALDEDFSQAWRRTGLALDRAGFTVEDRDRSRGLFFVRYDALGADTGSEESGGWLTRLKFWENEEDGAGEEPVDNAYLVRVVTEATATRIVVLDREGNPVQGGSAAPRILAVLHEQLQ